MKDMKTTVKFGMIVMLAMTMITQAFAQKIDEERMERDIEVAENVLSTLLRQEVSQQGRFFGLEVKGVYQEGYGVTFRLPGDYSTPMFIRGSGEGTVIYRDAQAPTVAYSYSHADEERAAVERSKAAEKETKLKEKAVE